MLAYVQAARDRLLAIVHAEDNKFLVVEETISGKSLWNQPAAGHWRQMKRWRSAPRVNCGKSWHHGATTVFLSVRISGLRRIRPTFWPCAFYSLYQA